MFLQNDIDKILTRRAFLRAAPPLSDRAPWHRS